jgi:hypothetical protein
VRLRPAVMELLEETLDARHEALDRPTVRAALTAADDTTGASADPGSADARATTVLEALEGAGLPSTPGVDEAGLRAEVTAVIRAETELRPVGRAPEETLPGAGDEITRLDTALDDALARLNTDDDDLAVRALAAGLWERASRHGVPDDPALLDHLAATIHSHPGVAVPYLGTVDQALRDGTDPERRTAAKVLDGLAEEYPSLVIPHVPALVRLLTPSEPGTGPSLAAIEALATAADQRSTEERPDTDRVGIPDVVAPHVDRIGGVVAQTEPTSGDADRTTARVAAFQVLTSVAKRSPERVVPAVDHAGAVVAAATDEEVDPRALGGALRLMAVISKEIKEPVREHVERLDSVLREEVSVAGSDSVPVLVQVPAVISLANITSEDPKAMARYVDSLAALLETERQELIMPAVRAFRRLGADRPASIADYAAPLAECLKFDHDDIHEDVVCVLSDLLQADVTDEEASDAGDPAADSDGATGADQAVDVSVADAVAPYAGRITECTAADESGVARNAAATLGYLSRTHPDHVAPHVESLVRLLDTEPMSSVGAPVADALGNVAASTPDRVVGHVETLTAMFEADDDLTRAYAADAVEQIATAQPESLRHHIGRVDPLLTDDEAVVRRDGISILYHVATESVEPLRRHAPTLLDGLDRDESAGAALSRVAAVKRLVEKDPEAVCRTLEPDHLDALATFARHEQSTIRQATVQTLGYLSRELPVAAGDDGSTHTLDRTLATWLADPGQAPIPVHDLLEHDDTAVLTPMLDLLRNVAGVDPQAAMTALATSARSLEELISHESGAAAAVATLLLAEITEPYPDPALSALPVVAEQLHRDQAETILGAAVTMGDLADESPGLVAPYTDELGTVLERADRTALLATACDALQSIAAAEPSAAVGQFDRVMGLLDPETVASGNNVRPKALMTASYLIHADVATPDVPIAAVARYTDGTSAHRLPSLDILSKLAAEQPAAVAPYVDAVVDGLRAAETDRETRPALRSLASIAEHEPLRVEPHLERVASRIGTDSDALFQPIATLGYVSQERPAAVAPFVEPVVTALLDEEVTAGSEVAHAATDVLSNVAAEAPDAVAAHAETLEPRLRGLAASDSRAAELAEETLDVLESASSDEPATDEADEAAEPGVEATERDASPVGPSSGPGTAVDRGSDAPEGAPPPTPRAQLSSAAYDDTRVAEAAGGAALDEKATIGSYHPTEGETAGPTALMEHNDEPDVNGYGLNA